jgi:hypothetical protein
MILRIKWRQAHHLYIGAGLFILALVLGYFRAWNEWACFALGMFGLAMAWDDIVQHWRNMVQPEYRSPGHRFFQWAWHKVFGNWWPFGKL